MGLWLAARLNCQAAVPPCGMCPACRQILDDVFLDLHYFDGGAESIKVDAMKGEVIAVGPGKIGEDGKHNKMHDIAAFPVII